MLGSKLSEKVIKHIENEYNGYVINIVVAGKNGTADLIACIKGKFFAFEIKGKGDKEKTLQNEKLEQVNKAGGYGGYVYSLNDVDNIVLNLCKPKTSNKNKKIKL